MRKIFNKFAALLGMLQLMGDKVPELNDSELKKLKISKPRFVAGDNFYQRLQMKRVNGKWKVRGARHDRYSVPSENPRHQPKPPKDHTL